ncbi:hypothetical protein AGDE_13960 [Angomonas deanei]|uniref:Uncharacterized protein n=1 Tax=Angomonas deanei TaxID=59799 RepID=A0A7G2CPC5_9TRYP|nr:hypothetical protein AGDE_13960 [Angomonas deanei]CAD2220032.1 hypothetical protein, conserved [Angomonas deanei]|eukprot:EPY21602.1 hypothetical protein AGDE_13960 [Angomonas deanei]
MRRLMVVCAPPLTDVSQRFYFYENKISNLNQTEEKSEKGRDEKSAKSRFVKRVPSAAQSDHPPATASSPTVGEEKTEVRKGRFSVRGKPTEQNSDRGAPSQGSPISPSHQVKWENQSPPPATEAPHKPARTDLSKKRTVQRVTLKAPDTVNKKETLPDQRATPSSTERRGRPSPNHTRKPKEFPVRSNSTSKPHNGRPSNFGKPQAAEKANAPSRAVSSRLPFPPYPSSDPQSILKFLHEMKNHKSNTTGVFTPQDGFAKRKYLESYFRLHCPYFNDRVADQTVLPRQLVYVIMDTIFTEQLHVRTRMFLVRLVRDTGYTPPHSEDSPMVDLNLACKAFLALTGHVQTALKRHQQTKYDGEDAQLPVEALLNSDESVETILESLEGLPTNVFFMRNRILQDAILSHVLLPEIVHHFHRLSEWGQGKCLSNDDREKFIHTFSLFCSVLHKVGASLLKVDKHGTEEHFVSIFENRLTPFVKFFGEKVPHDERCNRMSPTSVAVAQRLMSLYSPDRRSPVPQLSVREFQTYFYRYLTCLEESAERGRREAAFRFHHNSVFSVLQLVLNRKVHLCFTDEPPQDEAQGGPTEGKDLSVLLTVLHEHLPRFKTYEVSNSLNIVMNIALYTDTEPEKNAMQRAQTSWITTLQACLNRPQNDKEKEASALQLGRLVRTHVYTMNYKIKHLSVRDANALFVPLAKFLEMQQEDDAMRSLLANFLNNLCSRFHRFGWEKVASRTAVHKGGAASPPPRNIATFSETAFVVENVEKTIAYVYDSPNASHFVYLTYGEEQYMVDALLRPDKYRSPNLKNAHENVSFAKVILFALRYTQLAVDGNANNLHGFLECVTPELLSYLRHDGEDWADRVRYVLDVIVLMLVQYAEATGRGKESQTLLRALTMCCGERLLARESEKIPEELHFSFTRCYSVLALWSDHCETAGTVRDGLRGRLERHAPGQPQETKTVLANHQNVWEFYCLLHAVLPEKRDTITAQAETDLKEQYILSFFAPHTAQAENNIQYLLSRYTTRVGQNTALETLLPLLSELGYTKKETTVEEDRQGSGIGNNLHYILKSFLTADRSGTLRPCATFADFTFVLHFLTVCHTYVTPDKGKTERTVQERFPNFNEWVLKNFALLERKENENEKATFATSGMNRNYNSFNEDVLYSFELLFALSSEESVLKECLSFFKRRKADSSDGNTTATTTRQPREVLTQCPSYLYASRGFTLMRRLLRFASSRTDHNNSPAELVLLFYKELHSIFAAGMYLTTVTQGTTGSDRESTSLNCFTVPPKREDYQSVLEETARQLDPDRDGQEGVESKANEVEDLLLKSLCWNRVERIGTEAHPNYAEDNYGVVLSLGLHIIQSTGSSTSRYTYASFCRKLTHFIIHNGNHSNGDAQRSVAVTRMEEQAMALLSVIVLHKSDFVLDLAFRFHSIRKVCIPLLLRHLFHHKREWETPAMATAKTKSDNLFERLATEERERFVFQIPRPKHTSDGTMTTEAKLCLLAFYRDTPSFSTFYTRYVLSIKRMPPCQLLGWTTNLFCLLGLNPSQVRFLHTALLGHLPLMRFTTHLLTCVSQENRRFLIHEDVNYLGEQYSTTKHHTAEDVNPQYPWIETREHYNYNTVTPTEDGWTVVHSVHTSPLYYACLGEWLSQSYHVLEELSNPQTIASVVAQDVHMEQQSDLLRKKVRDCFLTHNRGPRKPTEKLLTEKCLEEMGHLFASHEEAVKQEGEHTNKNPYTIDCSVIVDYLTVLESMQPQTVLQVLYKAYHDPTAEAEETLPVSKSTRTILGILDSILQYNAQHSPTKRIQVRRLSSFLSFRDDHFIDEERTTMSGEKYVEEFDDSEEWIRYKRRVLQRESAMITSKVLSLIFPFQGEQVEKSALKTHVVSLLSAADIAEVLSLTVAADQIQCATPAQQFHLYLLLEVLLDLLGGLSGREITTCTLHLLSLYLTFSDKKRDTSERTALEKNTQQLIIQILAKVPILMANDFERFEWTEMIFLSFYLHSPDELRAVLHPGHHHDHQPETPAMNFISLSAVTEMTKEVVSYVERSSLTAAEKHAILDYAACVPVVLSQEGGVSDKTSAVQDTWWRELGEQYALPVAKQLLTPGDPSLEATESDGPSRGKTRQNIEALFKIQTLLQRRCD